MNPTPSPEAVEAAKSVCSLMTREELLAIIDRACRAYAARQNAELRKALEKVADYSERTHHCTLADCGRVARAALKGDEAL
jgi:hypothetical protein